MMPIILTAGINSLGGPYGLTAFADTDIYGINTGQLSYEKVNSFHSNQPNMLALHCNLLELLDQFLRAQKKNPPLSNLLYVAERAFCC